MTEPADTGFEQRLVERIALREACALMLTPRQRRVLRGRVEGYTLAEIGQRERVCGARIREIEIKALRRLRAPKLGLSDDVPLPLPLVLAPGLAAPVILRQDDFDKAAFLKHMRGMVAWREQKRMQRLQYEREQLAEMVQAQDARDAAMARAKLEIHEGMERWTAEQQHREAMERKLAELEQREAEWKRIREQREAEWKRTWAMVARVDIGTEELRQRCAWFSLLAGTYGWDQAMQFVAEYDAKVAASKVPA